MTDFPGTLTILSTVAAPAFFDVLGLAALGAPLIATVCEIQARVQRKAFLDKFAQHISVMGFAFLLLVLVVVGLGAALAAFRFQELFARVHVAGSPLFALYVVLAVTVVVHGLYRSTWRLGKQAHVALGCLACLCSLASVHVTLAALRGFAPLLSWPEKSLTMTRLLFPGPGSPLWPSLVQYAALAVSYAGALGLLFLLHRRDRDNYGRDYYAFAMRLAASWAALAILPALAAQPWVLAVLEPALRGLVLTSSVALLWGGAAALMALCAFLWWTVSRSGSPLRLKGVMAGAGIAVWLFHTLLLAVGANLFFS